MAVLSIESVNGHGSHGVLPNTHLRLTHSASTRDDKTLLPSGSRSHTRTLRYPSACEDRTEDLRTHCWFSLWGERGVRLTACSLARSQVACVQLVLFNRGIEVRWEHKDTRVVLHLLRRVYLSQVARELEAGLELRCAVSELARDEKWGLDLGPKDWIESIEQRTDDAPTVGSNNEDAKAQIQGVPSMFPHLLIPN